MAVFSSKAPAVAPKPMAASLLVHRFGDHRVDLAGHDRAAGLQVGEADLGHAGPGPTAHQPQIVGDAGQGEGDRPQRARRLDDGVAAALGLEVVCCFA